MIIQKIHRFFATQLGILPLCLLILFVTTTSSALPLAPSANSEFSELTDFTGEQLFRGIYFAEGPVADRISLLRAFDINRFVKDEQKRQEISDFQDQVMAKVKKDHAAFLQELKASVDSRNNYKIKNTIIKGNDILLNTSSALSGQERDREMEETFRTELAKKVDLKTASAAELESAMQEMAAEHIVIDIWILLPVCLILMCWVVIYIAQIEGQPEGLYQEQLVSEIAKL